MDQEYHLDFQKAYDRPPHQKIIKYKRYSGLEVKD